MFCLAILYVCDTFLHLTKPLVNLCVFPDGQRCLGSDHSRRATAGGRREVNSAYEGLKSTRTQGAAKEIPTDADIETSVMNLLKRRGGLLWRDEIESELKQLAPGLDIQRAVGRLDKQRKVAIRFKALKTVDVAGFLYVAFNGGECDGVRFAVELRFDTRAELDAYEKEYASSKA